VKLAARMVVMVELRVKRGGEHEKETYITDISLKILKMK